MTKEDFDKLAERIEADEVFIWVRNVNTNHSDISICGQTDDAILAATKTIIGVGQKSNRNLFQWINAATTICAHIRGMCANEDEKNVIQGFSFGDKEKAPEQR